MTRLTLSCLLGLSLLPAADQKPNAVERPAEYRVGITTPVEKRPKAGMCRPSAPMAPPRLMSLWAQAQERDNYGLPGFLPSKRTGQAEAPVAGGSGAPRPRAAVSPLGAAAVVAQRTTAVQPSTCEPPPPARSQFTTSDPTVWHFLSLSGVNTGDVIVWEFVRPDGTRQDTSRLVSTFAGDVCMWAGLNIADSPAASYPGNWTIRVTVNNAALTSLTFTLGGVRAPANGRICRNEITMFYQGAHSLGTAWARPVVETTVPMSALAISQIQGALSNLTSGLLAIPCIQFELRRIADVSARVPRMSRPEAIQAMETLILEIQAATRAADVRCDNGVNLEALFVTGVHLGAAIGWGTVVNCMDRVPADVAGVIRAHLETARAAAEGFRACMNNFDPVLLVTTVNLAAPGSEVFTQLVGLYNLLLWNLSLSDCCCDCTTGGGGAGPGGGSGTATLTGTVRNAQTGAALPNARVTIVGTQLTATSGTDGSYTIRNAPAGAQRVEGSLAGFITTTVNVNLTAGQTLTQNLSLSPVLQTGEIRITLNWTKNNGRPNDLDMHLVGPQPTGTSCFHIYYGSAGSLTAAPFAQLEVDNINVSGAPPTETIRISRLTPGIYRFYVHNYSAGSDTELSGSAAVVQAFGAGGQLFSETVPQGSGLNWNVFTLDGATGRITRVGTVGAAPPETCR